MNASKLEELEEQLYRHVLDKIDFAGLYGLEQMLWCLLHDLGVDDDELGDVAAAMVQEALIRAASDPMRNCTSVPPGVTAEEAKAVAFDETCPLCRMEENTRGADDHDHGGEVCPLCDDMARMWREQHAEALRRRGFGSSGARITSSDN